MSVLPSSARPPLPDPSASRIGHVFKPLHASSRLLSRKLHARFTGASRLLHALLTLPSLFRRSRAPYRKPAFSSSLFQLSSAGRPSPVLRQPARNRNRARRRYHALVRAREKISRPRVRPIETDSNHAPNLPDRHALHASAPPASAASPTPPPAPRALRLRRLLGPRVDGVLDVEPVGGGVRERRLARKDGGALPRGRRRDASGRARRRPRSPSRPRRRHRLRRSGRSVRLCLRR